MGAGYFNKDTIAAPLTPSQVVSPVGIIRISGADALAACAASVLPKNSAIAEALTHGETGIIESHKMYRCQFKGAEDKIIDEGLFVFFRGPNSFTGEDCVELHFHGSPLITGTLMAALLARKKARAALPGEFSFRAFSNGKMGLSQAEGISDLIGSSSLYGAEKAFQALDGAVQKGTAELSKELRSILAELEVDIDFSDQNVSVLNWSEWEKKLSNWINRCQGICTRFERMRPLRDGIKIALIGAPNSGKSTLFNLILGESRSIVSDIAGTTRDVVRERVQLHDLTLILSDTAGVRNADNEIEAEGIKRSFGEVADANLVFALIDGPQFLTATEAGRAKLTADLNELVGAHSEILFIFNKADKLDSAQKGELDKVLPKFSAALAMAAREGEGLDELVATIKERFIFNTDKQDDIDLGRQRHFQLLEQAISGASAALDRSVQGNRQHDLLACELRSALDSIGQITGETSPDDVLNEIFAEFCIGK